jgi:hypothetical protein
MKLTFAAAAFALLAAPVFADTMADPATMMCKDLMAMDMTGMMAAGTAIKGSMMDDAAMQAMTDEDVMKAAEAACKAHPDGMVMDAMKMKM